MDIPLGEQIVSLIATLAALTVAGIAVWGAVTYGVVTASGYTGFGLVVLIATRVTLGRSIGSRSSRTNDTDSES